MDIEVVKCSVCPYKSGETDRAKALKEKINKRIGLYNLQTTIAPKNERLKAKTEGLIEALELMKEVEDEII